MIPIIKLAFYDNLKSATLLKSQSVVAQTAKNAIFSTSTSTSLTGVARQLDNGCRL